MCPKFVYQNRNPRWKLDGHFAPLCQFSALQLYGQGIDYGGKKKKIKGSDFNTGPLYYSIVGTVKIIIIITNQGTEIRTGPLY